jgi:HEAT repeat protein
MVHYCPSCWAEIPDVSKCPSCGADIEALEHENYEAKLIRALRHPEPSTPIRAATILGELRAKAAVGPLIELVSSTRDPFIQEAGVTALGRIGDPRALDQLRRWSVEGALRVRLAAARALESIWGSK